MEPLDLVQTQSSWFTVTTTKFKKEEDLRSSRYLAAVHEKLEDMGRDDKLNKVHLASWRQVYERNHGKSYRVPDVSYDAWMCVVNERRYGFPIREFNKLYPNTKTLVAAIRAKVLGR